MPKRSPSPDEPTAHNLSPKKKSRASKEVQAEWLPSHQLILTRAIISLVMQQRTSLYTTPGLEAFRSHGSSKLGTKVESIMKELDKCNGGDGKVAKGMAKIGKKQD